jgi:hypothetical protein
VAEVVPSQSLHMQRTLKRQELVTAALGPVQPDAAGYCTVVEAYAHLSFVSLVSTVHQSALTERVELSTLSIAIVFHGVIHRVIILRRTVTFSRHNWPRWLHKLWLKNAVSSWILLTHTLC